MAAHGKLRDSRLPGAENASVKSSTRPRARERYMARTVRPGSVMPARAIAASAWARRPRSTSPTKTARAQAAAAAAARSRLGTKPRRRTTSAEPGTPRALSLRLDRAGEHVFEREEVLFAAHRASRHEQTIRTERLDPADGQARSPGRGVQRDVPA